MLAREAHSVPRIVGQHELWSPVALTSSKALCWTSKYQDWNWEKKIMHVIHEVHWIFFSSSLTFGVTDYVPILAIKRATKSTGAENSGQVRRMNPRGFQRLFVLCAKAVSRRQGSVHVVFLLLFPLFYRFQNFSGQKELCLNIIFFIFSKKFAWALEFMIIFYLTNPLLGDSSRDSLQQLSYTYKEILCKLFYWRQSPHDVIVTLSPFLDDFFFSKFMIKFMIILNLWFN